MKLLKQKSVLAAVLIMLPILTFIVSITIGRYEVSIHSVIGILLSQFFPLDPYWTATDESVVINLRIPRILLAMLVGAGLSISGASFQGIFRNPLVSPDILGVASGAGFGGIVALILLGNQGSVFISSFIFGIIALIAAHRLSRVSKTTSILMLVLSGVIVNAFFTAMISIVKFSSDPQNELPSIVFWLMGSLAGASYIKLAIVSIPLLVCMTILLLLRWRINILSLGDEDAYALGMRVENIRWLIIICVTIIVALSVSISGIIGWVGLAIPHIARMVVGPDHRVLLPASMSFGAVYLLLMDGLARTLTPAEIPLGILTAIIGATVFGYLLRKTKGRGWVER